MEAAESFFSADANSPFKLSTPAAGADWLESDWTSCRFPGLPRRSVRRNEQQKRAEREFFRWGDRTGGAELEEEHGDCAEAGRGRSWAEPNGENGPNCGGEPESRWRAADTAKTKLIALWWKHQFESMPNPQIPDSALLSFNDRC